MKAREYGRGIWGGTVVKNLPDNTGDRRDRREFNPYVRKIPWNRKWQPSPVFLPGKFQGQRSLVDYSAWGHKALDMTEWLSTLSLIISEWFPVWDSQIVLLWMWCLFFMSVWVDFCWIIPMNWIVESWGMCRFSYSSYWWIVSTIILSVYISTCSVCVSCCLTPLRHSL